ncbi:tetrathionate reductase family octaheme c-type cytochrome [Congregibacter litoralis]|uniref:Cytochrome c bacterial/Cytochrome c554 and c-prime n=1 Tax=Congregibacter litoralis KT71 TaxID=314285 RepID=A4ADP9_9GAMM|nr:tetrathionate reductase family octaheme c-type cytochrome [Congregibacter litoralis]EAQ95857.1 Cytochrome c bacterial/Cytochrome c554 and c-prime [Congregibacter litoralis KT71]
MSARSLRWLWIWAGIAAVILLPLFWVFSPPSVTGDSPWDSVPGRLPGVEHTALLDQSFASPQAVTARCLECHDGVDQDLRHSSHWTWDRPPVAVAGRSEPVSGGKRNVINNFCIGIQGNWASCTACHAGYGWTDASYDFDATENIDCLVCHDGSGTYVKGNAGLPVDGVDLREVAMSVGKPGRNNCGSCHFNGGGGDAVKHGDLDSSLFYPSENVDVHMGRFDFVCTDCHRTRDHQIAGRSTSVSMDNENQIHCTDCHDRAPHRERRLNSHGGALACQTCHIPETARRRATKTHWDWSTAGDESREEDDHQYLRIKGSFAYEQQLKPSYMWFNGKASRYILGDPIDPNEVTALNAPLGSIEDPEARIWPFKVHRASQVYDRLNRYLLQPETSGPRGFWKNFDWDRALRSGSQHTGLAYSGDYGFTDTSMYWPQTHMVAPKEQALQCIDCHGEEGKGRLDWQSLGYPGDPVRWGGRGNMAPRPTPPEARP